MDGFVARSSLELAGCIEAVGQPERAKVGRESRGRVRGENQPKFGTTTRESGEYLRLKLTRRRGPLRNGLVCRRSGTLAL